MTNKEFDRFMIYELIWTNPLRKIASKYKIKETSLKQVCDKLNIPRPSGAYWTLLRSGKEVEKTPFPDNENVVNEIELTQEWIDEFLNVSPLKRLINKYENDQGFNTTVPKRLHNPDEIVANHKKQEEILRSPKDFRYKDPQEQPSNVRITVSKEQLPRALRIMNTIIKLMRQLGYELIPSHGNLNVKVHGMKFELRVLEKSKRVKKPDAKYSWDQYEYINTGKFKFIMETSARMDFKEIIEGAVPMEEMIAKIMATIELFGQKLKKDREELEIRWEKQRIAREIEEKKQKRLQKEKDDTKSLFIQATMVHHTKALRKYLDDLESYHKDKGTLTQEISDYLKWGRAKADWFDPFINASDVYLDDNDKDRLLNLLTGKVDVKQPHHTYPGSYSYPW